MDDGAALGTSSQDTATLATPLFVDIEFARQLEMKARANHQHHNSHPLNGRPVSGGGQVFDLESRPNCNPELVLENERLREENSQLLEEIARLKEAAEKRLASPSPSRGDHSEGRLRAALTQRGITTAELRQAICAVESLVDEARRELSQAQLRERRAAFEGLHTAIDRGDEEMLEVAIEKARLAEVEIEDIQKGEAKLAELRALSPEQKAKKLKQQLESKRKKEAFILIKRDDAEALSALLEGLHDKDALDKVRWQDWRDYAGRSLWKCALDLRAARVQSTLAPLVGQRLPEDPNLPKPRASRPSLISLDRQISEDGKRPSLGSPQNAPQLERRGSNIVGRGSFLVPRADSDEVRERKMSGGTPPMHPKSPQSAGPGSEQGSPSDHGSPLPPSIMPLGSLDEADETVNNGPSAASDGAPAEGSCSSPARSDAEYAQLRVQAFRAVAQDDCDALAEFLEAVHQDIWSKWENKAGKDLLTLSQERGSSMAYSMLARELGMLKEAHREAFEEREDVWVFEPGEVQPRRATVIEDTTAEEEEVLLEFWDGDEPAVHVDRCLIHKMYA